MSAWRPVRGAERYALELVTERGTYTVCRARVVDRVRFTAWPPKPPAPPRDREYDWRDHCPQALGCFDDLDAAKRCCERHAGLLG